MLNTRFLLALAVAATLVFTVSGCSGNNKSSSKKPAVTYVVKGTIGTGNVSDALVYASLIDVQGQPDIANARKISTSNIGTFQTQIAKNELNRAMIFRADAKEDGATKIRCELVEGCLNANYKASYAADSDLKLVGAVGQALDGMSLNINWITHLASYHAYSTYSGSADSGVDAMYTPFTIERGNLTISRLLGIEDIISVLPATPSSGGASISGSAAVKQQSILYGALVAAGQKMAKDTNQTDSAWLKTVTDQLRAHQGQLYLNKTGEFSLCGLYTAAHDVLSSNKVTNNLSGAIDNALNSLAGTKNSHCAQDDGTLSNIIVPPSEVNDWADRFANAKRFLEDLNTRLVNFYYLASGNSNYDSSDPSFVEADFYNKSKGYYDALEVLYQGSAPNFDRLLQQMRDDLFEFVECINSICTGSGTYNAINKSYRKDGLVYTWVPKTLGLEMETGDTPKYSAFDFVVTGERTINGQQQFKFLTNKITGLDGKETDDPNFLRVVYSTVDGFVKPPLTEIEGSGALKPDYVEPLGFEFHFPELETSLGNGNDKQDLTLYFVTKLIGVKPVLTADSNPRYHYNITELSLGLNIRGETVKTIKKDGKDYDLRDLSELTMTAKTSDAANYYSPNLWPKTSNFFDVSSQSKVGTVETGMFTYEIQKAKEIVLQAKQDNSGYEKITADYLNLGIKNMDVNRFELFTLNGEKLLRKCSIDSSLTDASEQEEAKICTSTVNSDLESIEDIIYSDDGYLSLFAVPGHGAYQPDFPDKTSLTIGSKETINGILKANFSLGIDSMQVRMAQELHESTGTAQYNDFAPRAIANLTLTQKTKEEWEAAFAFGYNYDALIDVLPTGAKAQSFYISYFVKEVEGDDKNKRYFKELGGLSVFRGGVELSGLDTQSWGLTLGSNTFYEKESTNTAGKCGYESNKNKTNCDSVGYLTVRGSLVATVREERSNVYVARFSDGSFVILGAQ